MEKNYMKRGMKLVALSLQNDCDLSKSKSMKHIVQSPSPVDQEDIDLILPTDLGLPLAQTSSSRHNISELDSFTDFDQDLMFTLSNGPVPIMPYMITEDDSYIENSQDVDYTELLCPPKKVKLLNDVNDISKACLGKPTLLVPESPCVSDYDTDTTSDMVRNDTRSALQQSNSDIAINSLTQTFPTKSHAISTNPECPPNEAPCDTTSGPIENFQNVALTIRKLKKSRPHYSKEERVERSKEKHPIIIDDCGFQCHRKCRDFDIEARTKLWSSYWTLTHDDQIKWMARYIQLLPVKTKRILVDGQVFKKNESRSFFLPCSDGTVKQVCKTLFLNTYGYKNDSIITTISKKFKEDTTVSLSDKRGTHDKQKIDTTIIENFIEKYKPCTAHYRRHNAPNVKYLAQDITLQQIFENLKTENPSFQCSKEVVRRTLKEMNISLHRPKNDKCFDCLYYETSITEHLKGKKVPELKLLCKKEIHKSKAREATEAYSYDANKDKMVDERIYSMDLQKSVLLPMMPEVKDCFFTNRLICFNLTFCGLNKNSVEGSKCLVWHEASGGRDGKDIVDAIHAFMMSERDVHHFVLWADNCCAQNKNWILFTALVLIINKHTNIESITLKYLAKGHTHMSADGVHGNIEKNFRRVKNIYDFKDYKDCVRESRKRNEVIEVNHEEKRNWEKKKKTRMEPVMLTDVVQVKFTKGETSILYKKSFKEPYIKLDFLQKKIKINQLPNKVVKVRGIRSSKKKEIMDKLVPLMPSNRKLFWEDLSEDDRSADLIVGGQVGEVA